MDGTSFDHTRSSSLPSSPILSSKDSGNSSSIVETPEVTTYAPAMSPKVSETLHEPIGPIPSPGCAIEFSITVSSPFDERDSLKPASLATHFVHSQSHGAKRSAPLLARHRSLGSSTSGRTTAIHARNASRNRHFQHLEPFSTEHPVRQRDSDGMVQRPPPIFTGRRPSMDSNAPSSRSVSTGLNTPITIPSIPEYMRVPSLHVPSAVISPTVPMVPMPPKGHIQPHVTNLPRRRRREPKYTEAEMREHRRWDWERRTCLCEVGSGSGVYVSFIDDQGDDEFSAEFLSVIGIAPESSATPKENVVDDRTLQLTISEAVQDDGLPHLTGSQLQVARQFVGDIWSHFTGCNDYPKRLLVTTPRDRPTDAMAVATFLMASAHEGRLASAPSSEQSTSRMSSISSTLNLPPHPSSRPASPLSTLNNAGGSTMDVDSSSDHLTVPDVTHVNVHDDGHSAIHSILMRLHDMASEDDGHYVGSGGLKGPWRGVLSRDGMDFLACCMSQL